MQSPRAILNWAFENNLWKANGELISPIYFRSPERRGLTLSSCVVRIRIRAQYSISAEETSYDNRDYTPRTDRNHVKLVFRKIPGLGSEGMTQPFWHTLHEMVTEEDRLTPGRRSTVDGHNIKGSRGTEIIPELLNDADYVIDNKKRLDCFYGTDLKSLLEVLGIKNVILMGINTNTCVLNTAFTAFNHDYRVVVASDCVASMYGDDLHVLGLQNVARCLGWVLSNEDVKAKLEEGAARND
jgi:nicotinamidase-related amidase